MSELMKVRLTFMLGALFFAAYTLDAQIPSAPGQASYEALLAKLNRGDTLIDFTALRLAYSRSKNADPYGADHEKRRQMSAAVIESRCDEALKIADQLLATTFLSPDSHAAKSFCYRLMGDNARAEFHKAIYLGLINSVLSKGDGKSTETAYTAISIEEEYAVMRALGFTVWNEEYLNKADHTFNVLSGTDDRNKITTKIYFNVDIPLSLEKERKAIKP